MSEESGEYGLVMPFVIVKSVGGPYDDEAFTVGWEMAELDAWLRAGQRHGARKMIHSTAIAQADLLAMKNGYTMTAEVTQIDSWAAVTFILSEAAVDV